MRHLTASMLVIDVEACEVLLIHHLASDALMFPGGHVEPGEAPHDAALREVEEETGLRPHLGQPELSLPGMTVQPTPWQVCEIPAPPKPDRGPGKPAEPAHSHIDALYLATADASLPLDPQLAEVASAKWYYIPTLHQHPCRAEVPILARRAYHDLRWPATGADGR